MNFDDPDVARILTKETVLEDGLVMPPGERSEAEYRAKIARGEVSVVTLAGPRIHVPGPAGIIKWAGGYWENGEFVRESSDKW